MVAIMAIMNGSVNVGKIPAGKQRAAASFQLGAAAARDPA